MYCIKNQSIGVSWGALLSLFWNFEHVTSELFAGPLSADCRDVKKSCLISVAMGILNFDPKTSIKVLKYILLTYFFGLSGF